MKINTYKKYLATILCGLSLLQTAQANNVDNEISYLVAQFHQASTNGDINFIENITSYSPEALLLGTDPSEVISGHNNIVAWWQGLFGFLDSVGYPNNGGLPVLTPVQLQVGHANSVAWAVDQAVWHFSGGDVPFRVSFVFHKEKGKWKIVQQHFSIGSNNADLPL